MSKGPVLFKRAAGVVASLAICFVVFQAVQSLLISKLQQDGAGIIVAYDTLEKDSLDVLFLGSSQVICAVDSGTLTNEYGISSFNYASSGQQLITTKYYMDTALTRQRPKVIMLEVNSIFNDSIPISDNLFAWNYSPMPASPAKFQSLMEATGGNLKLSIEHTFVPLLAYHDRWKSFEKRDVLYALNPREYAAEQIQTRGFLLRDEVTTGIDVAYFGDDTSKVDIPQYNADAIRYMEERCKREGIELVLLKVPSSDWTKGQSSSVEEFAKECGLEYVDLNARWDEVGMDASTDLFDAKHLNVSGATKTTRWLAKYLQDKRSLA